jgi:hypothetical protein
LHSSLAGNQWLGVQKSKDVHKLQRHSLAKGDKTDKLIKVHKQNPTREKAMTTRVVHLKS